MAVAGRGRRKILVLGEAPGETEDRQGRPFIGEAGQLLRKYMRKAGVDLDDCWVTNAIACRPPDNVIEDKYIDACRPLLLDVIQKRKPDVIIQLGASAASTLIEQEWKRGWDKISTWVGFCIPSQKFQAWLCPTYHPSYIMRMGEDPVLVREFTRHLAAAFELEGQRVPNYSDWASRIQVVTDRAEAIRRMRRLASYDGWLAFDYETDRLKPDAPEARIICVSFCYDEGNECFAVDLDDGMLPVLSEVLRGDSWKCAANLKFEERWTRAKLRHGVRRWGWDTMLASHVLDNRSGICSVKFQAYVRFGIAGYDRYMVAEDHRPGNMDQRERLMYCGWDSLLEFQTMLQQREEMESLEERTA
jgi:uracil-DNA glycosylase family 4